MMSKIDLVGGKSIYVTYRTNAVQPPSSFSLSLSPLAVYIYNQCHSVFFIHVFHFAPVSASSLRHEIFPN